MIILNQAQADQVRGPTVEGYELNPIALTDGETFVLPEAVLSDPAHALRHAFLASLPTREIEANEWVVVDA